MKLITLSQGKVALVDDSDFDFLSQWKWSALRAGKLREKFYAVRMTKKGEVEGKSRMILMHRLLSGAPKGRVVDHRDNDGLNNQRKNIRVCTQADNSLNIPAHSDAAVKSKGVYIGSNGRFIARLRNKHIGSFSTESEAAAAYDRALSEHNSEFALTNAELMEAAL
jgi:hypothetical protein